MSPQTNPRTPFPRQLPPRTATSGRLPYGISGPAAGIIAGQFGYATVYLFGTACALLGAVLFLTARRLQS